MLQGAVAKKSTGEVSLAISVGFIWGPGVAVVKVMLKVGTTGTNQLSTDQLGTDQFGTDQPGTKEASHEGD